MKSFYSEEELLALGLKSYGKNVLISRNAQFYGAELIQVGDNVRIDDFCILSGNIQIGSNVHISAYCALYGSKGIRIGNYSGLSARTIVYSAMDDFSGNYLIGPIHDSKLTNVSGGLVEIKDFVQVGAGCVVFPDITINEGCVIGALSLLKHEALAWSVYAGVPAKKIKDREKGVLELLTK